MPGITLDIATKIIEDDLNIWVVFPGEGRKFLDIFTADGVAFLEAPGIELTPHVLQDDTLLRRHVAMSEAIAHWHNSSDGGRPPSRRADQYPLKSGASFGAAVGNVKNLYARMKPGDVVLTSGYGMYARTIIGEVRTPFAPKDTISLRDYPREDIPIRRVRWFRGGAERRFLSPGLYQLLQNRKAIISVPKHLHGDEIFKLVYGDYVMGTESRYIYEGPEYKNIATTTIPATRLISYFAAAFNACDINELDNFSKLDIDTAIDSYFEGDNLYSFEIKFSSPGEFILHAKRAALPLLVAVLVAASSGTISYANAADAQIVNSATYQASSATAGAPDACTIEIQDKYRAIMNSMGADLFNKLCEVNKAAQDGVGLKVKVHAKAVAKKTGQRP